MRLAALVAFASIAVASTASAQPLSPPPPAPTMVGPTVYGPTAYGPTVYGPTAYVPAMPLRMAPRSVPRRTTGQVLTIIGIAHLVAGGITMGVFLGEPGCEFCALGAILYGAPVAATGVIVTSVGVPLWVTGAQQVAVRPDPSGRMAPDPMAAEVAQEYVPRVSVGAGSMKLTVPF